MSMQIPDRSILVRVVRLTWPSRYGQPLVHFDPVEERRLVNKIDLYIIPPVAILYLFCFIDRANIGRAPSALHLL
jgi:hypothetical protein